MCLLIDIAPQRIKPCCRLAGLRAKEERLREELTAAVKAEAQRAWFYSVHTSYVREARDFLAENSTAFWRYHNRAEMLSSMLAKYDGLYSHQKEAVRNIIALFHRYARALRDLGQAEAEAWNQVKRGGL